MTRVTFYGTSGWFESERGCTSCVGVDVGGGARVLFDLGTGVRRIPRAALRGVDLSVVLTHLHLDHCYGLHVLPMFAPASLTILVHEALVPHLKTLFAAPFTKPLDALGFPVQLRGVADELTALGGVSVMTRSLVHNTPVIGARLMTPAGALAYCVDTRACAGLRELAAGVDTLIIETAPPPGRATNRHHLELEELRELLQTCGAGRVILTHFGATKFPDEQTKRALYERLCDAHPNLHLAHDGLELEL